MNLTGLPHQPSIYLLQNIDICFLGIASSFALDKPIDQILSRKNQSLGFYLSECLQDKDFSSIHISYTSHKGTTHDLCCCFRVRKDWRMQIIGAVCEAYDCSTIPPTLKVSLSSSTLHSNDGHPMVINTTVILTFWSNMLH